ncbi:MAG: DUF1636 domain-containing protein [Hyphomicrobium sp.]
MAVTLYVCITCRAGEPVIDGEQPRGARLHAAVLAAGPPDGVDVRAVECLSACTQGCSIALTAPGRWSYVYGRMTEADVPEILSGAKGYAAAPDGIVPWRERPVIFRKQSVSRLPPLTTASEAAE